MLLFYLNTTQLASIPLYLNISFSLKKDDRQQALKPLQEAPKEFTDAKKALASWLRDIEKTLAVEDFKISFLPIMEERLRHIKVLCFNLNIKVKHQ
jgi:hypothetical protein